MNDQAKRDKELDAFQKKVEEQIAANDVLITQAKKQHEEYERIFAAKGIKPGALDQVAESDYISGQDRKVLKKEREHFLKELAEEQEKLVKETKLGKQPGSKKTQGRIAI